MKPYSSDYPHGVVARITAFLAGAANESGSGRSNPLETVIENERQAGISKNPPRFAWNDNFEDGLLKVMV